MSICLRRREFIAGFGGTAAWPLVARAQQGREMRHVGVLMNAAATNAEAQSRLAAFTQTLRQLGWSEGRNIRIDLRWTAGDAELARIYAAQLANTLQDQMSACRMGIRDIFEPVAVDPVAVSKGIRDIFEAVDPVAVP